MIYLFVIHFIFKRTLMEDFSTTLEMTLSKRYFFCFITPFCYNSVIPA